MAPAGGVRRPPVIVKLGGSLVTRKREVEKLRPKVLARLAREIAEAGPEPLVVLHGAGSFGHPGAARFDLARAPGDPASDRERRRGAAIVSAEVRRLHVAVLRELVRAGASPWSVPPATLSRNRAGALDRFDPEPFEAALDAGLLPVSFGDVVLDAEWGTSILSADTIATELARRLGAARVVFATDVLGVLEGPARGRRRIVEEVADATLDALRPAGGAVDVTGGIRAKVGAMLAIARGGADAALISGLTDGALSRAIRGEAVYGSWAHARRP
jgi:isopentenyl phosphate kinase